MTSSYLTWPHKARGAELVKAKRRVAVLVVSVDQRVDAGIVLDVEPQVLERPTQLARVDVTRAVPVKALERRKIKGVRRAQQPLRVPQVLQCLPAADGTQQLLITSVAANGEEVWWTILFVEVLPRGRGHRPVVWLMGLHETAVTEARSPESARQDAPCQTSSDSNFRKRRPS